MPLFLGTAVSVVVLYITRSYRDVVTKISFATAYSALILLVATLLIGPWNLLRGNRVPISDDWCRDVGPAYWDSSIL